VDEEYFRTRDLDPVLAATTGSEAGRALFDDQSEDDDDDGGPETTH
jgi:hypothetical protein